MKHMKKIVFSVFLPVFLTTCMVSSFAQAPNAETQISSAGSSASTLNPGETERSEQTGQSGLVTQPAMKQYPSGLLQISDYKYPVYLYVPANYRLGNTYAMILVMPGLGAPAEEGIKYLRVLADRKSVFVLSPQGLWTDDSDVPYKLDEWILEVKKDVMQRFPIDKKRVFIAGKDSGAHYAAYFAMKYADQFAGAALIGNAWEGPFAKIMEVRSSPEGQVPFYVALRADQPEIKAKNQIWFTMLQEKGYPLHLKEVNSAEELSSKEFKTEMFDWLEKTGQNWGIIVTKNQKSFKAKLKKGVKDFFAV